MRRGLILLILTAMITGCGRDSKDPAIRIGTTQIDAREVKHWMNVLAPEHFVPDPPSYARCVAHQAALEPSLTFSAAEFRNECAREYARVRSRAIGLLITGHWLIGEAAREGLEPTHGEVKRWTLEGSHSSFQGDRPDDTRFVAEAELSAARIGARFKTTSVSAASVVDYYRRHPSHYTQPETREIAIAENFPTAAKAAEVKAEVASGRKRMLPISLHEPVWLKHPPEWAPGKRALARAIFAAKPHVLSAPLAFNGYYVFFEVTKIEKPFVYPLRVVKKGIETQLLAEALARKLAAFVSVWSREWRARTDCARDYVIVQCRQREGASMSNVALSLPD
jgi:hypothetical protein